MLSTTSNVDCSARSLLDRLDGLLQTRRTWPRSNPAQLPPDRIEHRGEVAVGLDRNERRAANLVRPDHPAGELGGERGLAFAALTAHHGIAFVAQQPLERE